MADLINRNSPFSPFSVNPVTEILRPPFNRGEEFGGVFGGDLLAELLSIADEVSTLWGDSDEARQRMRDEVMQTPAHLRADLLEHFQQSYRAIQ